MIASGAAGLRTAGNLTAIKSRGWRGTFRDVADGRVVVLENESGELPLFGCKMYWSPGGGDIRVGRERIHVKIEEKTRPIGEGRIGAELRKR